MAKKSLMIKQRRPQKFKTRLYSRCNRCGRPRGVPQVRPLPDLPADARAPGLDPGHDQVELVGETWLPTRSRTCSRIRNANKALHADTRMPTSRMKEEIARILKEEGYINDYRVEKGESFDLLVVELKYGRSRERVLTDLKRVSKPGRRVRSEGPPAARARGSRHGDHVDTERTDDGARRQARGRRRRSDLFRLVARTK